MAPFGPRLQIGSFEAGCILYLRSEEEIGRLPSEDVKASRVSDGCLKHPCLVVRKYVSAISQSDDDMVQICSMTSFRGNSLQDRFKRSKPWWASYLPVEPSPLNPQRPGILLRLVDNVTMRKAGYVNVGETHYVNISMLDRYDQRYSARHFRLDNASFNIVLKAVSRSAARTQPSITPPTSASDSPPRPDRTPRQAQPTSVRTHLVQAPRAPQASSHSPISSGLLTDSHSDRQYGTCYVPQPNPFTRGQDLERQTFWAIPSPCCDNTSTRLKLLVFFVLLLSLGLIWGNFVYF